MSRNLVTPAELLAHATGIDWNSIAENSNLAPAQAVEQSNIISQASTRIANYCRQRLNATTDTERAVLGGVHTKSWVDRQGWLWFHTDFFPVLSVNSYTWAMAVPGSAPAQTNALDVTKLVLYGENFRITRIADYSRDWTGYQTNPTLLTVTFVDGWPNTVLKGSLAAGAGVTATVEDTTGMTATAGVIGNALTLYDGANTEDVTVQQVLSATTVKLTNVVNSHAIGVGLSAVPSDVKEAVFLTCVEIARERGVDAIIMGGSHATGSGGEDKFVPPLDAQEILEPYRRYL